MTATLAPTELPPTISSAEALLSILDDAVSRCVDLDPDLLHSGSAAGGALVHLAALARSATETLGGEPGSCLAEGSGILIMRDAVSAVALLDRQVRRAGSPVNGMPDVADLLLPTRSAHVAFVTALVEFH